MGGALVGTTIIRMYAADASMSRKDIIYGDVSYALATLGATDPRLSLIVPFTPRGELKEDDMLIIAAKSVATDAFDSASVMRIPVTIKNMTTGIVRQAFLDIADFRDMADTVISGTDISLPAGVMTDAIKYTVKAQERVILGHMFAENSRIYLSLADT